MSIALSLGNNLTTGGVFKANAVNNTSCNNITDFAGIAGSSTLVLLSTQTASASASISFTTGIDSTYDEYVFKFINLHPSTGATFQCNFSTDGGSNYNVTKTSSFFYARHYEPDTPVGLEYEAGYDLAQSTSYQILTDVNPINNDDCTSGYLHLFNPSSTTYVKQYLATTNSVYSIECFVGGYGNTTSAINAVDFKYSTGNIDDGIIKMYGVAKA